MKYIQKDESPPGFLTSWEHRRQRMLAGKTGEEKWRKFKGKVRERLQQHLLHEQGHICAYCNQRIHIKNPLDDQQLRIEHLEAKSTHPDKTFDYYNLVGSCFGKEREPLEDELLPRLIHCDPQKANQQLDRKLFPTKLVCEDQLKVIITADGVLLREKSPELYDSVEKVLNLNHPKLQELRKNVLEEFFLSDDDVFTPEETTRLIDYYREKDEQGRYRPYSGVIITYLIQEYLS